MASNGSNDATAKETEAAQESFKRYVEPVRSRVFSSQDDKGRRPRRNGALRPSPRAAETGN
jgi:hypothetical protein|tara:strand:+ start:250 stop:432 length:183 start_codon:yes stop_codon:yes gene_type:complete